MYLLLSVLVLDGLDSSFEGDGERVEGWFPAGDPAGSAASGVEASDAEFGKVAQRALEGAEVGVGVLAWVQLDVSDPAVVVDDAVQMVVADSAVQAPSLWDAGLGRPAQPQRRAG